MLWQTPMWTQHTVRVVCTTLRATLREPCTGFNRLQAAEDAPLVDRNEPGPGKTVSKGVLACPFSSTPPSVRQSSVGKEAWIGHPGHGG